MVLHEEVPCSPYSTGVDDELDSGWWVLLCDHDGTIVPIGSSVYTSLAQIKPNVAQCDTYWYTSSLFEHNPIVAGASNKGHGTLYHVAVRLEEHPPRTRINMHHLMTSEKQLGRANEPRPVSKRDSMLESAADLFDRVRNKVRPKANPPKIHLIAPPPDSELVKRVRAAQIEARRIDRIFGMLWVDRCLGDMPTDWLETLPSWAGRTWTGRAGAGTGRRPLMSCGWCMRSD